MENKVNTKIIKISELKPNPWNPKLKPEDDLDVQQQFDEVVRSVKNYGLVEPIMVRSGNEKGVFGYYQIINGYHRFMACSQLGFKEVVINDLGIVSDITAKKLTIVTEEVKIPIDQVKLGQLIKEMATTEDLDKLAEGLPYSKDLLESKLQLLDFDWEDMEHGKDKPDSTPSDSLDAENDHTLILRFSSETDKLLVEAMFETITNEQKAKSISEGLVNFAKTYGK
jgi:hypothetical protein